MSNIILTCGCGLDFSFDRKEEFDKLGYCVPKKCPRCRAEVNKNFHFEDRSNVPKVLQENAEYLQVQYIQSGKFTKEIDEEARPFIFNNLIQFNFMNSNPEFDISKTIRCYNNMAANSGNFNIMNTFIKNINGVFLYVIFRKNTFKEVKRAVELLASELHHDSIALKAPIGFSNHFKSDLKHSVNENFWMDIQNEFIFCFGEQRALSIYNSLRYPMNTFYDLEEYEREIVEMPFSQLSHSAETLGSRIDVSSEYISRVQKELAIRTGSWKNN